MAQLSKEELVTFAKTTLARWQNQHKDTWKEPHVPPLPKKYVGNSPPEVTAEWRNGERKLFIWFNADRVVDYLGVWGPNVHTEMDDGVVENDEEFAALWRWLTGRDDAQVYGKTSGKS